MAVAVRVVILLFVAVGAGWLAAMAVMHHAANAGAMEPEVRLAGEMAALFAGGAMALVAGIAMVWLRKKP
jgi:hypothetical protein